MVGVSAWHGGGGSLHRETHYGASPVFVIGGQPLAGKHLYGLPEAATCSNPWLVQILGSQDPILAID